MHNYQNPQLSVEQRVDDLLDRLSLDEKIAQLHAAWLVLSPDGNHKSRDDAFAGTGNDDLWKEKLHLGLGQITRPLGTRGIDPKEGVKALNLFQKKLIESSRWGIPVLSHEECLSGLMVRGATLFPSSLAYGATWNPALINQVGQAIAKESLSVGAKQGLAPVLDVARDSRWGRTEETFAEDPYLTGVLATEYVKGLQTDDRQFIATLKHYVGHSYSEGGRNHAPVHLGWRELNDDFMLPFEMAVKLGDAGSVMPAYHDIDNEPVHASRFLLHEVLRQRWGFDGIIVADYIGITLLYTHHGVASNPAEAAALAYNAGLDVELPGDDVAPTLAQALDQGLISLETINEAVKRVLTEKFRVGLFETPYTPEEGIALRAPETISLARKVAEQAITILENDGILPLRQDARLAVIGPTADDPLALLGDYSFPVHLITMDSPEDAESVVTVLEGLRQYFPDDRLTYAVGCNILEKRQAGSPVFPGDVPDATNLQTTSPVSENTDKIAEAVLIAEQADIAVVCVGDLSGIFQTGTVGEGSDSDSLALPGVQQQLLQAVCNTGTPTVVVQSSGRPYNLGGLESDVAAYVMSYFGGEQGGNALARVLVGDVEPSGRLTLSVPRTAGACPYFYNHKFKSGGTPIAYHFGSRYPFGYGLSYTEFMYCDLRLTTDTLDINNGEIEIFFTLRNTGARSGIETPQLYVRDCVASCVRPIKELKAFCRVELAPSAQAEVRFAVPVDMLCFTGMNGKRRVEPGEFKLMIGPSSGNIALQESVQVVGNARELCEDRKLLSHHSVRYG